MPNTKNKSVKTSAKQQLLIDFTQIKANNGSVITKGKVVSINYLNVVKQRKIITHTVNYIKSF